MNYDELNFVHLTGCVAAMSEAQRIAESLIKIDLTDRDSRVWTAAYMMLVIQYCKPFKTSRHRGKPFRISVPDYLNVQALQTHHRLIELRDKFVAHGDLDFLGQHVAYLRVNGEAHPMVCNNTHNIHAPDPEEILDLVSSVRKHLVQQSNAAREYLSRS